MKKRIKTTAGILFLGLQCVSGTYGYFSDTLQVVNHISVGDIKISMEEYEKKGTKEVHSLIYTGRLFVNMEVT